MTLYYSDKIEMHSLVRQVRLWKVARSQESILADMRKSSGVSSPDLFAYWKFDDPDQ